MCYEPEHYRQRLEQFLLRVQRKDQNGEWNNESVEVISCEKLEGVEESNQDDKVASRIRATEDIVCFLPRVLNSLYDIGHLFQ